MILTKANLAVAHVADEEHGRYSTGAMRIEKDGTTVATDGTVLVAMSPIPQNPSEVEASSISKKRADVGILNIQSKEAIGLIRKIPTKKNPNKNIEVITKNTSSITVNTPTGKALIPTDSENYPKWKKLLQVNRNDGMFLRMSLKKSSLLKMMKAIEASSDENDENVIHLEVNPTRNGFLRLKTRKINGQELLGLQIGISQNEAQWGNPSKWELELSTPENKEGV